MRKILEVNNVTKYYGGAVVTKALDGISLSVDKGVRGDHGTVRLGQKHSFKRGVHH